MKTKQAQSRTTRSSVGQSGVVSTLGWLGYLIVTAIPIVGLIMCFVWAFGTGNLNRRNLFRAVLILMAASIVLGILFGVVLAPLRSIIKSYLNILPGIM